MALFVRVCVCAYSNTKSCSILSVFRRPWVFVFCIFQTQSLQTAQDEGQAWNWPHDHDHGKHQRHIVHGGVQQLIGTVVIVFFWWYHTCQALFLEHCCHSKLVYIVPTIYAQQKSGCGSVLCSLNGVTSIDRHVFGLSWCASVHNRENNLVMIGNQTSSSSPFSR